MNGHASIRRMNERAGSIRRVNEQHASIRRMNEQHAACCVHRTMRMKDDEG